MTHWQPGKQKFRSTHLATHLSELKGIETFNTLCDTVAGKEVQSLGDTQVEVNAKAPD